MDKVNLQTFRLDNNFKNSESSEEGILASLFTIPISEDNDMETREFVFPSKSFDFLDKSKLLKIFKSLNIDIEKDLNIQNPRNTDGIIDRTTLLKLLKSKIIPDTNNKLPDDNKFEFKINLQSYINSKKSNINKNKSFEKTNKLEKMNNSLDTVNLSDNISRLKKIKTDTSLINEKQIHNNQPNKLNIAVSSAEDIDNEENLYQIKNTSSSNQSISLNTSNLDKLNLHTKFLNENQNQYSNNQTRIDNSTLKSHLSNDQSFNGDKNMNFLLDNYIEELNMTEKGWTEKLVIRLEKAVKEGTEEIELFLKPKELGTLKVNLLLNKNNARIMFRAENNFVVHALQQSENLLTKLFNEQGMQIETTNYESNNFNNQSDFNSNNKNYKKSEKISSGTEILNETEKEQIDIENSNYIINVKA